VKESATSSNSELDPGLCGTCQHCRRIESSRGSVFVFCELSLTDPNYPKYPRLPVLSCAGYMKKDSSA
jgi:hypothetical protein